MTVASRLGRSVDPANPSETVYEFANTSADEVCALVQSADSASRDWARTTPARRADILLAVADELDKNIDSLATLITREEGKTIGSATGEVRKTIEQFRFASQLAYQVEGRTFPQEAAGQFAYTLRSPLGVIVAITPWNFPLSLAARKIAPALAAGNPVVFKPSPVTAGCGRALVDACHAAGVPESAIVLVEGDDHEAMAALVGAPEVRAVSFTGSDGVGAILQRTTHPRTRRQFELGGHNASIVAASADIAAAAQAVSNGAFGLTGQACTATDRVLVDRSVLDDFVAQLVEISLKLRVGPGLDTSSNIGPVATPAQYERLNALLEAATQSGTVLGQVELDSSLEASGYWVPPTIVTDLPEDHAMNTAEVFGPLLSVIPIDSVTDGLKIINESKHGLVSAIHTRDLHEAQRFAQHAETGIVKLNQSTTGNGVAPPFGGWKESSSGAFPEGGTSALDFVTDTKSVYLGYQED